MKDLSLFLLKNSLGARMRKGIRTFCNGDDSTSTLNQHLNNTTTTVDPAGSCNVTHRDDPSIVSSPNCLQVKSSDKSPTPTLEEMILQLELEEEMARKAKLLEGGGGYGGVPRGRMSCVNNSDILRSARNALNQYPRFSLDGKDAMYRSSFRNLDGNEGGRKSVCCDRGLRGRFCGGDFGPILPAKIARERVVWCKPGVVAKLMGLEAMPVPILGGNNNQQSKEKLSSVIKRQNLWRRAERHEMERRVAVNLSGGGNNGGGGCEGGIRRGRRGGNSCSKTGYCVVKPVAVAVEPELGGWPTRRFL